MWTEINMKWYNDIETPSSPISDEMEREKFGMSYWEALDSDPPEYDIMNQMDEWRLSQQIYNDWLDECDHVQEKIENSSFCFKALPGMILELHTGEKCIIGGIIGDDQENILKPYCIKKESIIKRFRIIE